MEQALEAATTKFSFRPEGNSPLLTDRLTEVALDYQTRLLSDPTNAEALLGMGLVALASGQTAAAVQMACAGVSSAPQMIPAWVTLGQALMANQQFHQAEQAYQQAISMDGMDPLAHTGMGELRLTQNMPKLAAAEFELALRKSPAMAAARLGLGNAFAFLERNQEALDCYEQTLQVRPRMPEAEFAAGFVLGKLGRIAEALTRYRRAIFYRPDFAAAWLNLGCLLRDQNQSLYAEAALLRAVELRPDLINAWINLGLLERDRHQPDKAEKYLLRAISIKPDQVETLVAWCQFRAAEKDFAGAWSWLRWALLRSPDHPEALNMLGILLHGDGRYAEAVEAFLQAERQGHKPATSNRGNVLLDMGKPEDALAAHKCAVERDPECPGALYNLALTRLRMGEWLDGWREYEMRWKFRSVHLEPREFREPRWRGQSLQGQRVLLHAEQGLGDTIQFCRFANLVVARGGHPHLVVQKPVERLIRSMDIVHQGRASVSLLGEPMGQFDYECPLMSLPAVFETTIHTVPWSGAYLAADPDEAALRKKLTSTHANQLRVGLAWAGNPRYRADHLRSMKLLQLLPLLRTPGFSWIALQKNDSVMSQIATLPDDVYVLDGSSQEQDLAETAALIDTLDLVVTTDTCVAHLAGAMNKPTWILLPWMSDWRWMQQRETTPWYPSVRLLRQANPGDWPSAINRAIAAIKDFSRANS